MFGLTRKYRKASYSGQGTGTLIGLDYDLLIRSVGDILKGSYKQGKIPELWDGNTTKES